MHSLDINIARAPAAAAVAQNEYSDKVISY